jgi:hypothetical protein
LSLERIVADLLAVVVASGVLEATVRLVRAGRR